MFIQTEATPNPSTLKFLPGRSVTGGAPLTFADVTDAEASPLAARLFAVDGVTGVFFGEDFVTVTKGAGPWGEPEWPHLKPALLGAIMEHYLSGEPLLHEGAGTADDDAGSEFFDEADEDTVEAIKDLIDTRVRPAVAADGGDITFRGYREGVVYLNMKGSCSGCPSSTATLKQGIQNLLRHFVPEVQEVRAA